VLKRNVKRETPRDLAGRGGEEGNEKIMRGRERIGNLLRISGCETKKTRREDYKRGKGKNVFQKRPGEAEPPKQGH